MYRINDKQEAIKRVQEYLRVAGNDDIFVAPTGIFDDNTRNSVIYFQADNNLAVTGEVDRITFDYLFGEYSRKNEKQQLNNRLESFIRFPLLPGQSADGMLHINIMMGRLLDYYRQTHRLRDSNFYSPETSEAVRALRRIYMLPVIDLIDEVLYLRMTRDHDSINNFL